MSALPSPPRDADDRAHHGGPVLAGAPVVIRRRAGLAALIGAAASAVAIAYLWRASQTMMPLDWSVCAVMTLVAGYYLTSLIDARTPLAVADHLGVRIRLGDEWRGLPWEAISRVAVHPRRGPLRDGRLEILPDDVARAVEGLDGKAKRHARLNQKLYGAPLAVPVGFTTRVVTDDQPGGEPGAGEESQQPSTGEAPGLAERLSLLARGATEVAEVTATPLPSKLHRQEPALEPAAAPADDTGGAAEVAQPRPASRPPSQEPDAPVAVPAALRQPPEPPGPPGPPGPPEQPEQPEQRQPSERPEPTQQPEQPEPPEQRRVPAQRRRRLGGIGLIVSRVRKTHRPEVEVDGEVVEVPLDAGPPDEQSRQPEGPSEAVPLRHTRRAMRAEVTRDVPATGATAASRQEEAGGSTAVTAVPHQLRPDPVEQPDLAPDSRVRPISRLGDSVEPLVIDDFITEPARDPVIGPEVMAARTRLGLSVDELADRTRIRPHVIEAIEVDDFAPCGGDFYARGHLRTLARVLGTDPAPLVAAFDDRYATAPVNARRVFEAELATGMRENMRGTMSGPNWGLLIGVVLALVLVWGVVRFFSAEPADLVRTPAPVLNGSAGLEGRSGSDRRAGQGLPAEPVPVVLTAQRAAARVVVRADDRRILFRGMIVRGDPERLRAALPIQVNARGRSVNVSVQGKPRGTVGGPGQADRRTFG